MSQIRHTIGDGARVEFTDHVPGRQPIMRQRWEDIAFLHWPVARQVVECLLPPGLQVDTIGGSAWVGLVPFRMVGIGLPTGPQVPYLGTFAETNVRTYVKGPDGPGVWFHSLEAERLLPVAMARLLYRLPYFHASMRFERNGDNVIYNTIRRWPGPRGVGGTTKVRIESRIAEPTELDHFLTARWRLYALTGGRLSSAEVRHPAWPLYRARPILWDGELVGEAGYPTPDRTPHTLFSPGVGVQIYRPVRVGSALESARR